MIRCGAKDRFRISVFVEARVAETRVCCVVIWSEIEIVLNQHGARESVVANAVPAHPRIHQRERQQEESEKPATRVAPSRRVRSSGEFNVSMEKCGRLRLRRRHFGGGGKKGRRCG